MFLAVYFEFLGKAKILIQNQRSIYLREVCDV